MNQNTDLGYGICPVCFEGLISSPNISSGDYYVIVCPRCGKFKISRTAARIFQTSETLGPEGSRLRANLAAWIRDRVPSEMLDSTFFDKDKLDGLGHEFWSVATPTFNDKMDKLLRAFEDHTEYAGEMIDWENEYYLARAWVLNKAELAYLVRHLSNERYIEGGLVEAVDFDDLSSYVATKLCIAPRGWMRLDELRNINQKSKQCFVAMWFDESLNEFYQNGVAKAIHAAHFSPRRIDNKEHVNKIDDEIIKEINRSRFIVADFTEHRGGVYYEAGYGMGLGIPIIWTCRKDHIEGLHFDIRQYNCLLWEDGKIDEFAQKLQNRIEALFVNSD